MKLAVRPACLWKCRGPAENPAVMMTTAMEFVAGDGVRGIGWNGATMEAAVDSSRYVRPCCFFLPLVPLFFFFID